jgi:hypothetical protein
MDAVASTRDLLPEERQTIPLSRLLRSSSAVRASKRSSVTGNRR